MSIIPNDLKYAKTHEWAKLEQDGLVRVGISDFAQGQLGDVVYIELPDVGRKVKAGEACAVIESVKAASDIYSPVSGEIMDGNAVLSDSPEWVNQDSYVHWLFRVKASDPSELDKLLTANEYESSTSPA
ncbi:MAG: glycine cleavage system protein GcvH [Proteobacteria bacterium]|nr:glycine cleavage system protein GcvH [Pseudomonadota bacterium]